MDYETLWLDEMKKKLTNYEYRFDIQKEISLRSDSLISNPTTLKEFFFKFIWEYKIRL